MTANKSADGTYGGTLYETAGPAFSTVPFDPTRVSSNPVGSATLSFRDVDHGILRYAVHGVQQTKYITREVFGPVPSCAYQAQPDIAAATNYTDLWWVANGAESGWGINLTHQGDTVFATWFTYYRDGKPMWLVATAPKVATDVYTGKLFRTTGPAFSAQPFDPAKVTREEVGTATFTFTNGNAARFAYTVNGISQSKAITRELFYPPGATRCGDPARTVAPFTVAVAGDIADCNHVSAAQSPAARTANLVSPADALVLTLGDQAYENGTPSEYANCFNPTWGAFKDRIRPAPGNHDYYTDGADGYYSYFGALAGPPDRRGYYSFDYGGWHFIMLNAITGVQPGSGQYQWLADDLAKSRDSLCTIAVMHYPAFNSGANHGSMREMLPAFDALQSAGVEIVLSGHEHVYERFAPQRADGTADPARGLRDFTVGTGGGILMAFKSPLPNSEFRFNETWGILRLTLGAGQYSWQYLSIDNPSPIDSGSGTCHP
jgi:calcineurin-like phosphoesterase family protein